MKDSTAETEQALISAAKIFGEALRHQAAKAAALARARSDSVREARDRDHSAACEALDAAEHEVLVLAAVVGGLTRKKAEKSV